MKRGQSVFLRGRGPIHVLRAWGSSVDDPIVVRDDAEEITDDEASPSPVTKFINSIVVWFDCAFDYRKPRCPGASGIQSKDVVNLPTGPEAPTTHWFQTLLPLPEPVWVAGGPVQTMVQARTNPLNPNSELEFTVTIDGTTFRRRLSFA